MFQKICSFLNRLLRSYLFDKAKRISAEVVNLIVFLSYSLSCAAALPVISTVLLYRSLNIGGFLVLNSEYKNSQKIDG